MKRTGQLLESVAEPANLQLAFWKAARGKNSSQDVIEYRSGLEENLSAMRDQILDGSIEVGHYHFFKIYDPKERDICAAAFPERVLHHALINICEPVFEKRLVFDTYACRTGKGRIKALERAQHYARKHAWFLKLDVRRYFDSINQAVMVSLLERILKDKAVLKIFRRIIACHSTSGGKGLPIGNLTSQHFANLYLGELDHYAKEVLRAPGYVRYMDDFVLWADDKETLQRWHGEVTVFLHENLKLTLKPPQINRSERGLPFLGCLLHPNRLRLDARGRRRFTSKLSGLESEYAAGKIGSRELQTRASALIAYTDTSGGAGFRRAMLAKQEFGMMAMDGPVSGSNRMLRGGNWNNNATNARCGDRSNNNTPSNTNNNYGFRSVRSSEMSPQWDKDSDPVVIPPAPSDPARQSENTRPVLVAVVDATAKAPGGRTAVPAVLDDARLGCRFTISIPTGWKPAFQDRLEAYPPCI